MRSQVKSCAAWFTAWEPALLLATAPALLFPGWWSAAAALLVALVWACRRLSTGRWSVATPIDGALAGVFLASLVGLVPSISLAQSLSRFWAILLGLALFYSLVNRLTSDGALRLAGDLATLGGAGFALLALFATRWSEVRLLDLPLYRSLAAWSLVPDAAQINPRVAGMALAMLVPVALVQGEGSSRRRRLLGRLSAGWMALVMLLTQSVQAALGLAVALCFLAARRRRAAWLMVPLLLGAGGAALWAVGPARVAGVLLSPDHTLGAAVTLRLDMWGRALAMVEDMPLTGIGLDMFPLVQTSLYPGFLIGPEPHAHNLILQVALDLGVPGLLAFAWVIAGLVWLYRAGVARLGDAKRRGQAAGAAAGILAYLTTGLVDTLWPAKPNIIFWILLGLAVAELRHGGGQARRAGSRGQVLGLSALVLLVPAMLLVPGVWHRNAGMLLAGKSLARVSAQGRADPGQMSAAARHLASLGDAEGGDTWRALGRLYGWMERYPEAVQALARGVDADAEAPLARYAPWLLWKRAMEGGGPTRACDDLRFVYSQWRSRFPDRAELYVQAAMLSSVCGEDPGVARSLLAAGQAAQAKPRGLLTYYGQDPLRAGVAGEAP